MDTTAGSADALRRTDFWYCMPGTSQEWTVMRATTRLLIGDYACIIAMIGAERECVCVIIHRILSCLKSIEISQRLRVLHR